MKLKLPYSKLRDQKGFSHVELIVAVFVIVGVGFAGVRMLNASHAATVGYLNETGCHLRGRNWVGGSGNPCGSVCSPGTGSLVTNAVYNYCSYTESKLSSTTCSSLGRLWLTDGCARRADQRTTANAPQCSHVGATYYVESTYDKCSGGISTGTVSCSSSWRWSNGSSGSILGTISITNGLSTTYTTQGVVFAITYYDANGQDTGSETSWPQAPGSIAPHSTKTTTYSFGDPHGYASSVVLAGYADGINCSGSVTWSL